MLSLRDGGEGEVLLFHFAPSALLNFDHELSTFTRVFCFCVLLLQNWGGGVGVGVGKEAGVGLEQWRLHSERALTGPRKVEEESEKAMWVRMGKRGLLWRHGTKVEVECEKHSVGCGGLIQGDSPSQCW